LWLKAFGTGVECSSGMTLEQLRIFVAVAQIEHFTRASEKLGMSQSAVSAAIAALEHQFKISLFDRARRHVELTSAGNVLLAEAETILADVDRLSRAMDDLAELRIGRLSIAASQTVAGYWIPPLLNSFHDAYPGILIDLWDGNSTEVEKRIARGHVDIGIIEQEPGDTGMIPQVLATDRLVLVVGPQHPWFARQHVEWSELTETSWIMRESGSGTRALFEAALIEHGIAPGALDVALSLPTGEAICGAVAAGSHAAVMSSLVAAIALKAGALRQIQSIEIKRNFNAVWAPGRTANKAAAAFLDHVRVEAARPARGHDRKIRLIP
jgi:DNA-binding transcriptional LysR family regulator